MVWMVVGFVCIAYGLKGERVPGRVLSITDTHSNSLRPAQRVAFVAVGICALVFGFLDIYARYKRA